jgi:nucleotide-binding universal stress UspA family protein
MNNIKKILCPVDFSEYANEALKHALLIAEKNHSSIHLLHVLPKINYYDWNMNTSYPLISEELLDNEKSETKNKLIGLLKNVKLRKSIFGHNL